MNNSFDLDGLLSAAADDFSPSHDPGRLTSMITRRSRRRRAVVVLGAAASVVLLGSVALAYRADDSRPRLGPANDEQVTEPTRTTEKSRKPLTTEPADEEVDVTEPKDEVDVTEPKVTEPKTTKPKTTEPKVTEPKTTEPQVTEPKTTEPDYELVAYQVYGSCAENPPFDVFYGTTAPGANVTIYSEWSEPVDVTANENGEWEIRVYFSADSPLGQEFWVKVISGDFIRKFWFTHTEAAE